jgi:hypothetical protein
MPTGVWKTTEVPKEEVPNVMSGYAIDGPIRIEKEEQPNGKWTVTAIFAGSGTHTRVFGS